MFSIDTERTYFYFRLATGTLSVSDGDIVHSEPVDDFPDFQIALSHLEYTRIRALIKAHSLTHMYLQHLDPDKMTLVSGTYEIVVEICGGIREWDVTLPGLRRLRDDAKPFTLVNALKEIKPYISKDSSRTLLQGVKVADGFIYATDGIKLIRCPVDADYSLYLTADGVKEILNMDRALILEHEDLFFISNFKTTVIAHKDDDRIMEFPPVESLIKMFDDDTEHPIKSTIRKSFLDCRGSEDSMLTYTINEDVHTLTWGDVTRRYKTKTSSVLTLKADMSLLPKDHISRIVTTRVHLGDKDQPRFVLFQTAENRTIVLACWC